MTESRAVTVDSLRAGPRRPLTEGETVALVTGATTDELHAIGQEEFRSRLFARARMPDGEGLLSYCMRTRKERWAHYYLGTLSYALALDLDGETILCCGVRRLLQSLPEDENDLDHDDYKWVHRSAGFLWSARRRHGSLREALALSEAAVEAALAPLKKEAFDYPGADFWDTWYGLGSIRADYWAAFSRPWTDDERAAAPAAARAARARWSPCRAAWIEAVVWSSRWLRVGPYARALLRGRRA